MDLISNKCYILWNLRKILNTRRNDPPKGFNKHAFLYAYTLCDKKNHM